MSTSTKHPSLLSTQLAPMVSEVYAQTYVAVLQVILSLDELNQLPGKGRFGTFLHNITKFYYTYHQCGPSLLPRPTFLPSVVWHNSSVHALSWHIGWRCRLFEAASAET